MSSAPGSRWRHSSRRTAAGRGRTHGSAAAGLWCDERVIESSEDTHTSTSRRRLRTKRSADDVSTLMAVDSDLEQDEHATQQEHDGSVGDEEETKSELLSSVVTLD